MALSLDEPVLNRLFFLFPHFQPGRCRFWSSQTGCRAILQIHDNIAPGFEEDSLMKKILLMVLLFSFAALTRAADMAGPLAEKLQKGLFEEEANHNLSAAIEQYKSVITQGDEQRKLTATALLRLAESYRKLGRTNEAQEAFTRVIRDFSDQKELVQRA